MTSTMSANHIGERMRVLQVLGNALAGGVEQHVLDLARRLPAEGCDLVCVCPHESGFTRAVRDHGCDVLITPVQDDPRWRSIQLVVEAIRRYRIDLVHAHMPKAHALAGLAGSLTGVPVLATVHGMNITSHELGITRAVASHLIVVCQEAEYQALAMGVSPERITRIANGVDTDRFTPHGDGAAFRHALGVPEAAPLIGFAGRLSHEKGPDQFVQMAARVLRERADVHFALVGDGNMAGMLRATVAGLGLAQQVHFAGHHTDMAGVYPAFDILAATSRSEGMPLALLEAMACGCPVVAMAAGGVAEVVELGVTGLTADPGDWEGIALRVLDLLATPEHRRAMAGAARRRVEERFRLERSVRETVRLYRDLIRAPAAMTAARPLRLQSARSGRDG